MLRVAEISRRCRFEADRIFFEGIIQNTSDEENLELFDADDADVDIDDDVGADVADGDDVEFKVDGCCNQDDAHLKNCFYIARVKQVRYR